jgi:hypothetical protein
VAEARAFAADLRSSLRRSSQWYSRLAKSAKRGKKAMRMNPKFVTTLSDVSPYQP